MNVVITKPEEILPNLLVLCRLLSVIPDPGRRQAQRHPLLSILVMGLCAMAAGATGWEDMADTSELLFHWFSAIIPCGEVPPSADTFRRVFQALRPGSMEGMLTGWLSEFALNHRPGRQISFDGKALRGSDGVYTVNAYVPGESITLAHQVVDDKTNELGALPALLAAIEIENTVCTGDALYAQREVIQRLQARRADYLIAVKANQGRLLKAIETQFGGHFPSTVTSKSTEKDRGWLEERQLSVSSEIDRIDPKKAWTGLQSVIKLETRRTRGNEFQSETRYFISSLSCDLPRMGELIRSHWEIENCLHRVLDVHFKEDACQVRNRVAAANLSLLRKLSGSILRRLDPDRTLKSKMKALLGSNAFRLRFLQCDWADQS